MNSKPIIVFDGVCNFCNYWVNFIIKRDRKKKFLFTAIQSETGKKIFKEVSLEKKETVVLIYNGKYFFRSDAALQIAKILGGKWIFVYLLLKITPKFFRNFIYDFVAKNRYRWFGKKEVCMIADEKIK